MKRSLCFIFLLSSSVYGFDNPYVMRSGRGLLMGDAFTAVNDDALTLFYNPASLGRHRRDFSMSPLNGTFSGTNLISDLDRFEDFPKEPIGASKVLMDYPAHASAATAPGFKLFNFAFSGIVSESYDLLLRNRANPTLDVDLRSDRGFATGLAIPLSGGRLNRKSFSGQQTSLGIGAKYIERSGVFDRIGLVSPTVLDSLDEDEVDDIVKGLGRVKGKAWGFDAGLEHVIRTSNSQMVIGLAALDIGGTDFKVPKNEDKIQVANNRSQVNLGLAFGQDLKVFHYILSGDVRALNEEMDFGKRMRLGAEFGIPGISILAGMNSGYYSYGAALNLGFVKLTGGFYDVELGSKYRQVKGRRFVVSLSLFDFSFDA